MKDKISVIVTAYNCEPWIGRCLDSIVNQTYENLEVLVVDDGSEDGTNEICQSYASRYPWVRVIRKRNGGVSQARNTGIQNAGGEWLTFVDGDDWLGEDILKQVMEKAQTERRSLYMWNVTLSDGERENPQPPIYGEEISKQELIYAVISGWKGNFRLGNYIRAVWGKLYRTEVIQKNGVSFDSGLYMGEDAVFLLQYLLITGELRVIDRQGYFYRVLRGSTVRRYKEDLFSQGARELRHITEALESMGSRGSAEENTSVLIFCWRMYQAMVHNGKQGARQKRLSSGERFRDAKAWYALCREKMLEKKVLTSYIPRYVRMQRCLGKVAPLWLLCLAVGWYDDWKERK